MKPQEKFSLKKRLESFRYAFEGVWTLIKEEHNARIHIAGAITAVTLGFYLNITQTEWFIIVLCIGLVFSAEAFNSALEKLADKVSSDYDLLIKKCKDLASAGVLFISIAALIVGLMIFIPKLEY